MTNDPLNMDASSAGQPERPQHEGAAAPVESRRERRLREQRELAERMSAPDTSATANATDAETAVPAASVPAASVPASESVPAAESVPASESAQTATTPAAQDRSVAAAATEPAAPAPVGRAPVREQPATLLDDVDDSAVEPVDDLFAGLTGDSDHGGERKRRGGCLWGIVALILVISLAAVAWGLFGDRIQGLFGGKNDFSGTGNGTEVEFTIIEGDTGTSIGERLQEQGIVKSSEVFVDEILSRAEEPQFHPGTYALQEEMSAASALDRLIDPDARVQSSVTIPEGLTNEETYALLEEHVGIPVADLEAAAANPQEFGLPAEAKSVEGFLFPATYTFEPGTDAKAVITTMTERTFQALNEVGVPEDKVWDVIRMASLIEKEVFDEEDRYKVSRVFYNRIDVGMPLQSDATINYWTDDFDLTDASNPYNTYVHTGLMPGPISNPSQQSIDAALKPADGPWLYFVTVNFDTGETVFSETYEEHEKAVAQWQAWMDEHPEYKE